MSRTLAGLLVALVITSVPAFAQDPGAGKLELSLIPAGWVSLAQGDERPEAGFGQYFFGGAFTVNWPRLGIEADLIMAPGRSQNLDLASGSLNRKTPHVVIDSVNLVFPLLGNRRKAVPYVMGGIGEVTIMRTSDDIFQPDTETFTIGNFGGGMKWHSSGRWGFRGDYRFAVVRSKFDAPGAFFGRELRKSHRFSGGLVVNLIPLSP